METAAAPKPTLRGLGSDLTHCSRSQTIVAVALPFACVAAFFAFAFAGYRLPALVAVMAFSFISYGSTSHDLVHGNLGLRPFWNSFWLSLIELLGLRSGHAYRAVHLHHHARFPQEDDLEGEAARFPWWRAVLSGPTQQIRIWLWAVRHARRYRTWISVETVACVLLLAAAGAACQWTWIPLVYFALAVAGSWVNPLATSYFPHNARGADALNQTKRFRGPVARFLFLDHLYHLEHHLYPRVPRHHWAELARRLDPWLDGQEVPALRIGL